MAKPKHTRSVYFKEPYLWEKIAQAAADQNRSVNNYLETLISAHLFNESLKK